MAIEAHVLPFLFGLRLKCGSERLRSVGAQAPPEGVIGMMAPYLSDITMTRLSHKMFNRTPEELPPDLQSQLADVMRCGGNDLQGYIRPGYYSYQGPTLTSDSLLYDIAALNMGGGERGGRGEEIRVSVAPVLDMIGQVSGQCSVTLFMA